MANKILTDAEVEREIEKLIGSKYIKLARKEECLKRKRRNYLNTLKWYDRRGRELAAQGMTVENIESMIAETEKASESEE